MSSKAATENASDIDARYQEGLEALNNGNDLLAEQVFRDVLEKAPKHAEASLNFAYLLSKRRDTDQAEYFLRQTIRLNPQCAEAFLNLGALLTTSKRYDEAEAICTKAVTLNSQSPQPWSNLGVLYARLKREKEAEQCHRTAMRLSAEHKASRFNLSYLLLRQGRYEEGWSCLEERRWYTAVEEKISCPRWRGQALADKSLLITPEAGHGDMIQFIRYARVLREQH